MKILITGGTNGMGKGVAEVLAGADAAAHEIIILCRSKELGERAVEELRKETKNDKVSIILCDLAKLSDVGRAADEIRRKHAFLDGIFINAGLGYAAGRVETEDGMDSHFQVKMYPSGHLAILLLRLIQDTIH